MNELQYLVWRKLRGDKIDVAEIQKIKKCNYTVASAYISTINAEIAALARVYAQYPDIAHKLPDRYNT